MRKVTIALVATSISLLLGARGLMAGPSLIITDTSKPTVTRIADTGGGDQAGGKDQGKKPAPPNTPPSLSPGTKEFKFDDTNATNDTNASLKPSSPETSSKGADIK